MLTAAEILRQMATDRIRITPFNPEHLQPNSYDVTLAPTVYELRQESEDVGKPVVLDIKKPVDVREVQLSPSGTLLRKHHCYLATHLEYVWAPDFIMTLHGRSTLARYFVSVHQSAGFGDLGFEGHWTLEIVPMMDVMVYPKIRVAQIAFMAPQGNINVRYKGRYVMKEPRPKLPYPVVE